MKIADSIVVGAMTAPKGKAVFDRANLVLASRTEPRTYVQVRAYIGTDEVEGKPLTQPEWLALVRSQEAIALPEVAATSGAALWVLRRAFEGLSGAVEELRTSGALLCDVMRFDDGSIGCLLREPHALGFREGWAAAAEKLARAEAKRGRWEQARGFASQAFVLERSMTPERVALLALACARCGSAAASDGYIEMSRRSRGEAFKARVLEQREDLEQALQEAVPASVIRPRFAADRQVKNSAAMRAGLGRLGRRA
jgi:hypothetical protein